VVLAALVAICVFLLSDFGGLRNLAVGDIIGQSLNAGCIRGSISAAISGQLQFWREPGVTAYHSNLYRTS
jgi:hypothetical protein